MRRINVVLGSTVVLVLLTFGTATAQRTASLSDNAALRYWAAFSQLQDAGITDQQAKELNSALDSMGALDISQYNDLIEKNTLALEIMARGTSLPNCDWGLDYSLGGDVPVDYARKALILGRLNLLYAIHLYHAGEMDKAVDALAAGVRFSHDVANGGSLFATLVAKELLVAHLAAIGDGLRMNQLSVSQRSRLQSAVLALGDGLDWPAAARRDLEALGSHYSGDSQISASLGHITSTYAAYLKEQASLPSIMDAINQAPPELAHLIPNPKRVYEQEQGLGEKIRQTRMLLQ